MGKCDAHTFEYMQVWVCDLYMPFHVLLPVYVCVRVIQQHLAYAFIHLHLWGIWSMTAEHRQGGESAESHCLLTLKERKTIPPCVGEPTAFTGSHRFNSTCFVLVNISTGRFQVVLSLWSVTSCLCIDKIPEVAKTEVSKPKRYSLSKWRLCHVPLKWLIQTHPHMSTSRCRNICVWCGFSKQPCQGEPVYF